MKSRRLLSGEMEGLEIRRGTQECHRVIAITLLDLEGSTGHLIYYYKFHLMFGLYLLCYMLQWNNLRLYRKTEKVLLTYG